MPDEVAKMRPQVYKDPRPEAYFTRFHERTRTREPDWVYPLVAFITKAHCRLLLRARSIGAHNLPAQGPMIIAPNHFSFMDHFLVGMWTRRRVQFVAKSQLFKRPMQFIYTHGGVFPVRRGYKDEEAFITANTVLGRGGAIVMYCEGGRSRTAKLSDTARPGIGRLALESGAPVVPVAVYGSAKVRNWKRLQFPRVTVQFGEPLQFDREEHPTRERQQEIADLIFAAIKELYRELEQLGDAGIAERIRAQRRATRAAHA